MSGFDSLDELRSWCERAPEGTALPACTVAELLAELAGALAPDVAPGPAPVEPLSWRERLWTVPAETRLGTAEAAEALGKPRGWIYRHTRSDAEGPLPHRKLDGALTFTAGELRAWIRDHEDVQVGGRMDPAPGDPGLRVYRNEAA